MSKEGFLLALQRAQERRIAGIPSPAAMPMRRPELVGRVEHFAAEQERAEHLAHVERHKSETPF